MSDYRIKIIKEYADSLLDLGLLVYLSEHGTYGIYTDHKKERVISFTYGLGGIELATNHTPIPYGGTGWACWNTEPLKALYEAPPLYADRNVSVLDRARRYLTLHEHIQTYYTSRYKPYTKQTLTTNQEDTMTNKTETTFKPLTQLQIKHALKRLEDLSDKAQQTIRDSRVIKNTNKLTNAERIKKLRTGDYRLKPNLEEAFEGYYTYIRNVIDFGDDDTELFTVDELNNKLKVIQDLHTEAKDKVIFAGSEEALQVLSSMNKTFEETVASLLPNKVA